MILVVKIYASLEQMTQYETYVRRFRLLAFEKSRGTPYDTPLDEIGWIVRSWDFLDAELSDVLEWIDSNVPEDAIAQIGVVLPAHLSASGNDHDHVLWLSSAPDASSNPPAILSAWD